MSRHDVLVVGSGVIGSFAAEACAAAGARVAVLDTPLFENPKGASAGGSRRCNVPRSHPAIREAAEQSIDSWTDLRVVLPGHSVDVGSLSLCGNESQLEAIRAAYRDEGAAHEVLSAAQLRKRGLPIAVGDAECALFDPAAFLIQPESVLRALRDRLESRETRFIPARATKLESFADRVELYTNTGEKVTASQVVLALGRWTGEFLQRELGVHLPVQVTREDAFWFATHGEERFTPGALPSVDDLRNGYYLFPDFPTGHGVKVAHRGGGPTVKDVEDESPKEERREALISYVRRAIPELHQLIGMKCCWYVVTHDSLPIIGTPEGFPRVTFFAGCNGSSFKLAPQLGRILASLALESHSHELPEAFSLRRFTGE